MIFLTIFTPSYNRAHTLPRTYSSLCRQNCKDFVWLIIDDGSTDNTAELVQKWQRLDNGFEIRYIYKENGGMHTAHNVAYENITTELNACIDSDDCLADGAIEKIINRWQEVRDRGYAGLIGLDADMEGNLIGKRFTDRMTETTLTGYYAAGGAGDKKLVYRTDIIRKYPPYPVFEGEKYVALAYKYRLIDQDYKLAVINDILCNVEYQPDGSSCNMWKQYADNPQGFAFWRTVQAEYPTSTIELIKNCIHYCASKQLAKQKKRDVVKFPNKALELLCTPFGMLLSTYIKHKNR